MNLKFRVCPSAILLTLLITFNLAKGGTAPDYSSLDTWLSNNFNSSIQRLTKLLSIPSVSSDPDRTNEVRRAAEWLISDLKDTGLENVQLLETKGYPSVYADWLHADPSSPTVLIYAHFDVQPEDPVSLWDSAPFEPQIKEGRIIARGASDDKGNLYVPITAIRAYLKSEGKLPMNVKLLLEGEEEIGSPNLRSLLLKHQKLLRSDYALSADGGQIAPDIPGIILGLRGDISMEVKVTTAESDMHSGMYGGGVQNPIHALVRLMDSLKDQDTGKILIDGYYDDVDDISDEMKKVVSDFHIDYMEMLKMNGVNETVGEQGFSFYERTWLRPSIDIVGITGGFQGEGIKTVLPREASAKISSRLVTSQKSEKALFQLKAHLEKEAAKLDGVKMSLEWLSYEPSEPSIIGKSSIGISAARSVLATLYGREPLFLLGGGSIPAVALLHDTLGLETVIFGFGNPDEKVHAPNEFVRLSSIHRGQKAYVRILWELKEWHKMAIEERDEL